MEQSIPAVDIRSTYNYEVLFDGGTGVHNADIMYGIAEIYSWNNTLRLHKIQRPTADSQPWARCVALPGAKVVVGSENKISVAAFWFDNRPIIASLTATSDAPSVGDSLGTVKDSWGLKKGNTGFTCLGLIVDATGRRFVYVRPGGSTGGAFQVVQALSDGSLGVVSVKSIQFLADVSASPNFEQTGDAFNCNYFKL